MKHLTLSLLVSAILQFGNSVNASAAVPLRWTVETSANPQNPATFDQFAGATYDLEATLQSRGKPLAVEGDAQLFWQTNGMGAAWWTAPATVSGNVLRATWTPSCDVGAKVYNCFIGITGTVYNAAFQLRLRPSPGSIPNALPLPTPVIDFAKVTILNPPWSGGGGSGGVDTNAVIDIVRKTVDGSARYTPKYLWIYDCADSHPDDAAAYYLSRGDGKTDGGCSAVRDGGFLYRNFDFPLDERAEFVVRMSAGRDALQRVRFASVGVAQVGTNLTEQMVTSGKPSRWYKSLPGATTDGINERGVVAEVNVVDGDPQWRSGILSASDIHPLAAVRWVLDNAASAEMAASNLAARIKFPSGWTQNFHWMIADESSTYIVENGAYSNVTGRAVMTNFPLIDRVDGMGLERYNLLVGGASITNAWFTRAYSRSTSWESEFKDAAEMESAKVAWETHSREELRGKGLWQTVHTSVYDITNRTLRVCVQETPDWYTFAVPSAGGVKPDAVKEIVEPMIGAATNGLRRVDDMAVYTNAFSQWTIVPPLPTGYALEYSESVNGWHVLDNHGVPTVDWGFGDNDPNVLRLHAQPVDWTLDGDGNEFTATRTRNPTPSSDRLATMNGVFAVETNLTAKIDVKRDLTNNVCAADAFGEWVAGPHPGIELISDQPNFSEGHWTWLIRAGGNLWVAGGPNGENAQSGTFSDAGYSFTATRSRVCVSNDTFVTHSFVTNFVLSHASPPSPTLRLHDDVLGCWWIGRMVNGVMSWEVE